jgi:hypothetical protein
MANIIKGLTILTCLALLFNMTAAVDVCTGKAVMKVEWPQPELVEPFLLQRYGVRISISGLTEGKNYHAYLLVVPFNGPRLYKEFSWSEGFILDFEIHKHIPDGPLQLRLQVFSEEGCLEGAASMNGTISTDMGLVDPLCKSCVFFTGWASSHIPHWETLFFASPNLPPLNAHQDILDVGSWEGAAAIWLFSRLHARSITCVDTWPNGTDQTGYFASTILPGQFGSWNATIPSHSSL